MRLTSNMIVACDVLLFEIRKRMGWESRLIEIEGGEKEAGLGGKGLGDGAA